MPKATQATLALNRGIISRYGLARIDLARTGMAAEVMTNWMPRVMGAMSIRPGLRYIDTALAETRLFPFVFAEDDTAQLELSADDSAMTLRVRVDDELVTRVSVTAAVTNGNFVSDVTGWTDNDEAGATSDWLTGYMSLLGTGTTAAIRDQQVTVNEAGTEHALRIVIERGPVILRVGSTSGGDDYITETTLGTGTHSLAFTPTGNFHIRLMNRRSFTSLVDSVNVESAGAMEIDFPWTVDDLPAIRISQSGDVIYCAADGRQQRKIERRGVTSWSVVLYQPETGPFRNVNTTPITLTPSGLTGDITISSSKPFFRSTHVGALFRIQSTGQTVTESVTAEDTFTDEIRVAGVGGTRQFSIFIFNTFTATVTLQQSIGEPGNWTDVTSYSTAQSITYNDELDNQIIYYRIGVKAGEFGTGQVDLTLFYSSGSIIGVARITAFTDSQSVSAIVLKDMGATTASSDWWEGAWSDRRGWPSAVALFEGRLWWAGQDKINGSIVDAFEDFDDEFEGDSGPISRSIGEGPVETINWLLPLNRLMVGTLSNSAPIAALKMEGNNVLSGRSSSLDEPLTPTNFNLKTASAGALFVQRSRQRLMSLTFNINESDYKPDDMTVAVPELCEAGIVQIAVQYQPDTRVHCVLEDGTVAVMVLDRAENVICWILVETDGAVEDVSVLPGDTEDRVYYVVNRDAGRFIEKFALQSECRGRPSAYLADAHVAYSGAATTTIGGLSHLNGQTVVVWGWNTVSPFIYTDAEGVAHMVGRYFGEFTVSGGQITGLSAAVTNACVGLAYDARFKSAKQAFAAAMGTPLNQTKKIDHVGLILADTHAQGVQFGPDFDHLDNLPLIEDDDHEVDENAVHEDYDKSMHPFDSEWTTDARVCLKAQAPKPATVLCFTASMTTHG